MIHPFKQVVYSTLFVLKQTELAWSILVVFIYILVVFIYIHSVPTPPPSRPQRLKFREGDRVGKM